MTADFPCQGGVCIAGEDLQFFEHNTTCFSAIPGHAETWPVLHNMKVVKSASGRMEHKATDKWQGRQGSNLGMPESKSGALPLGDAPLIDLSALTLKTLERVDNLNPPVRFRGEGTNHLLSSRAILEETKNSRPAA